MQESTYIVLGLIYIMIAAIYLWWANALPEWPVTFWHGFSMFVAILGFFGLVMLVMGIAGGGLPGVPEAIDQILMALTLR